MFHSNFKKHCWSCIGSTLALLLCDVCMRYMFVLKPQGCRVRVYLAPYFLLLSSSFITVIAQRGVNKVYLSIYLKPDKPPLSKAVPK